MADKTMKKILPFILFLLVCKSGFSQDTKFQFGITVKPNLGFFKVEVHNTDNVDAIKNKGVRIGLTYGLQGEYLFSNNYALEIDVLHTLTGGKYEVTYQKSFDKKDGVITERNWNLQFIEIPIAMRLKSNEIGYMTYYAKFGFNPYFVVKSRGDQTKEFINGVKEDYEDVEFDATLVNIGNVLGLGAMYSLGGNTYIVGGIAFHNGFTQIDRSSDYNVKHSYLAIDLGIIF